MRAYNTDSESKSSDSIQKESENMTESDNMTVNKAFRSLAIAQQFSMNEQLALAAREYVRALHTHDALQRKFALLCSRIEQQRVELDRARAKLIALNE